MRSSAQTPSLFPLIAVPRRRRAPAHAAAPPLDETPRAQFRPLACSSLLNENPNPALPFRWTINPYRGCEFGCAYCYARYTHEFLDHADPESFETRIYVKFQAAQVLAETMKPGMLRGRPVAIGTATDPYQPAEKRFRITRRVLEVLARCPDLDLSITTKSPLVTRDLDLLLRLSRTARLAVNVSLITLNPSLARIVERHAPTPRQRVETIRALSSAGIDTGVFVMPILPGITDSAAEIRAILESAKDAGAAFAEAGVVRLYGPAWKSFEPILQRHFPELLPQYRGLSESGGAFPVSLAGPIMDRFRDLRANLGLTRPARCGHEGRSTNGWLFSDALAEAETPST